MGAMDRFQARKPIAVTTAVVVVALLCMQASPAEADTSATTAQQPFVIRVDGKPVETYLSPFDNGNSPNISSQGTSLSLQYGRRYYAMRKPLPHSSWNASDFFVLDLVGKTLNMTVDLNGADCGCNAAAYLVAMPSAKDSPGANNDWYCDANDVGGNSCPEIDLTEMNVHALHTTLHKCSKPYSKSSCDGGGFGVKFGQGMSDFGKGTSFTIDTTWPFVVSYKFYTKTQAADRVPSPDLRSRHTSSPDSDDATLSLDVVVYQGTRTVKKTVDDASDLWQPLSNGMVLTFSFWGSSSMGWLDSPPCNSDPAQCPSYAVFSDISIAKSSSPTPGPTPSPPSPPSPCPGPDPAHCNCSWTKGGSICPNAKDDGSECFCRCCCSYRQPHKCRWSPPVM